jgi:hypothetical protein
MQRPSIRSGRISLVLLASLLSVALIVVLVVVSGPSPRTAAEQFMSALAKGDVDRLTELSIVHDKSKNEIHKEWELAVKYGQTYTFSWEVGSVQQQGDTASVRVDVTPTIFGTAPYAQPKPLQLQKVNGVWKVDVAEATRDMYPYLPQ